MADTGNGATLACGTSGFTAAYNEIDPGALKRGRLNASHLNTTPAQGEQYIPADLVDHDEVAIEWQYNPNQRPPIDMPPETITLTLPPPSGFSNGATLSGQGFFTEFKPPKLKNNEIMVATGKISWTQRPTMANAS